MRTGIFVLIVSLNDVSGLNISTWYRTISNKSRVMSDESCFTTDAVVRRQVKNFSCELLTLRKIWSFPLRISPVNVTKILRELHNKNIRTRSGTLFWRFLVNFEPIWHVVFVFFIVTFLKKMPPGINQLKKAYVSRLISPKFGLVNMEQLKYPLALSWRRPLAYRSQLRSKSGFYMITGFYMIETSFMKELNR